MEFGIFNSLYLPRRLSERDPRNAEHNRLMDEVAWTRAADRAGFKYTWATEHHFLDEYSHLSANESFLAYLAGVTERIHIGSGIFNITPPVNHPARIAERAAMLDHLSGGRFELGMGRGSSTTEQRGFGITDPDLTKKMFDEVVAELPKMWADSEYEHDGEFFSMPARNVLPKPYTRPHPPMWVAAGNPGTFEKAARMGLGVLCFAHGTPDQLAPLIEIYKKNIEKAEPVGGYVNNNVMVTSQMLCLEDGARAREIATDITMSYQNSLVYRYLDTFPKPAYIPDWPQVLPEPTVELLDLAIGAGHIVIGDPQECERAVRTYADIGADQLTFGMLSTTMPVEVACEAVEVFGRHVLPIFDRDPVHSTTRQRAAQLGDDAAG
ncbi:Flavin-dependent oxidoreductase, luciferase family (includes alkanesulfonate monooxygenase SsuD and methylene tetrahydromethanopterin reductase) [Parafrankia irregularis]|uniref:Flavin-dependent oxidoreductase, luciferase family (Includes alkanesulfonate monooxygenase SsuD and methylene tetrahydromethanopterin reductase) n=1 Tax=Parafrankia irregularis TaxID=795642 RepID=A0A0S4QNK2_9ACTN|nr:MULTISPECIES: LLM class flavin-dependent oxidoreductase [Parafrankia]MBE3202332.1 LLM class flavin-dependent oxidoreductase [Parafrankia sp. CH37]CUU56086.1 Flavin-dependent oxidoreductase, luciferase family (includes alkanesulfonate monooxygenase SsuD and methylene tetrahydromethanopterin reductase) [Parafrankia irregularis]